MPCPYCHHNTDHVRFIGSKTVFGTSTRNNEDEYLDDEVQETEDLDISEYSCPECNHNLTYDEVLHTLIQENEEEEEEDEENEDEDEEEEETPPTINEIYSETKPITELNDEFKNENY
jgi:hypothetical protein